MKARSIYDSLTGNEIPVTKELNVSPLTFLGKEVTTSDGVVMNDRWIYVNMPRYGYCAINVNRSSYCQKLYLMEASILDDISGSKITPRLKDFVEKVADKYVFEKNGLTYRVYLTKIKNTFDLGSVKLFWLEYHSPNMNSNDVPSRFRKVLDYSIFNQKRSFCWAHNLNVDLEKAFNFHA